jgi:hypothetical protein
MLSIICSPHKKSFYKDLVEAISFSAVYRLQESFISLGSSIAQTTMLVNSGVPTLLGKSAILRVIILGLCEFYASM